MFPGLEGIEGFLSLEFFRRTPVTVDYPAGVVVVEDAESLAARAAAGNAVDVRIERHGPTIAVLLPLDVPGRGSISVEVDSGSDSLILDEALAADVGVELGAARRVDGRDETGHAYVRYFTTLRGAIGPTGAPTIRQRDPAVMFQSLAPRWNHGFPHGVNTPGGGPTTRRSGARRAGEAGRLRGLRGTRGATPADRIQDRVSRHGLGRRRRGGGAGRVREGVRRARPLPRGAPFRPWLLQIVVNEARNRRRSAGRREHLALRVADERSSGGAAPSPEAQLLAAEERDRLLRAVAALDEDDRLVVSCRHFLGLSEEETAAALGLRVGTVKSRLSRALARVRVQLGEEGS